MPTAETTRILAIGIIGHMVGTTCSFYLEALRKPNIVTAVSMSAVVVNLVCALILVPEYGARRRRLGHIDLALSYMAAVFPRPRLADDAGLPPRAEGPEGKQSARARSASAQASPTSPSGDRSTSPSSWRRPPRWPSVRPWATRSTASPCRSWPSSSCSMSAWARPRASASPSASGRGEAQGVKEASRLRRRRLDHRRRHYRAIAIILLREPIAVLMLNGSEAASAGAALVPWLSAVLAAIAFVTVFDGLQGVGSMAMRAQGVVWIPTSIHVGSYVFVMLPLCWWLAIPQGMGIWGVVVGISVASVVAGLAQIIALEIVTTRIVRLGIPSEARSGHCCCALAHPRVVRRPIPLIPTTQLGTQGEPCGLFRLEASTQGKVHHRSWLPDFSSRRAVTESESKKSAT